MKYLLLLFLSIPLPLFADTIAFSWDPVTQSIDNTPVENLIGYKLYCSRNLGVYPTPRAMISAPTTKVTITEKIVGKYFCVVTAYGALESAYSSAVTFSVLAPPKAPSNLKRKRL